LAIARQNAIRVYRLPSAELLADLGASEGQVEAVAISPDEHWLAAGLGQSVFLWDLDSKAPSVEITGHQLPVRAVAFSRDGKYLASGDGLHQPYRKYDSLGAFQQHCKEHKPVIRLWGLPRAEHAGLFSGHAGSIHSLAFTPDSELLLSTADDPPEVYISTGGDRYQRLEKAHPDRSIRVWRVRAGNWKLTLEGHKKRVNALAAFPDGLDFVSASEDKTIRVWSLRDGAAVSTITGDARINGAAVHPSGSLMASATLGGAVNLWWPGKRTPGAGLQ
jgi:WD40 repeat protein